MKQNQQQPMFQKIINSLMSTCTPNLMTKLKLKLLTTKYLLLHLIRCKKVQLMNGLNKKKLEFQKVLLINLEILRRLVTI